MAAHLAYASSLGLYFARAPSYLSSRLLGYVTIGYIEPRTHCLGNWSPRCPLNLTLGGLPRMRAHGSLCGCCVSELESKHACLGLVYEFRAIRLLGNPKGPKYPYGVYLPKP